jgi:hypothetical protein
MNREDIIRMAREAGGGPTPPDFLIPVFEHFAALVASAEREACAKLCWSQRKYWDAEACADAIRARGQA